MNNLQAFIEKLESLGVELWVEGQRLKYRGPPEVLTATTIELLRDHKPQIIKHLWRIDRDPDGSQYLSRADQPQLRGGIWPPDPYPGIPRPWRHPIKNSKN